MPNEFSSANGAKYSSRRDSHAPVVVFDSDSSCVLNKESQVIYSRLPIESELHPYMATIFREHSSPSLIIDGTDNHVHALFALARTITIANLVEELKTGSSKWIKTKGREFKNFHWQKGYGAFSIGQSNVVALKRYIRNQKQHHRRVTFEDEYRNFLKRYEVAFDERYMWD